MVIVCAVMESSDDDICGDSFMGVVCGGDGFQGLSFFGLMVCCDEICVDDCNDCWCLF